MIYQVLEKNKKKRDIRVFDEYKFYSKNCLKYASILSFYHFTTNEIQPFRIIQANIIIKSEINKDLIESALEVFSLEATQVTSIKQDETIKNKLWDLLNKENAPYFSSGKSRIYIPIFSKTLNLIYNEESSKILEYPYTNLKDNPKISCVDLFDVYNLSLYNSPFTSLILIKEDKTSSAFYHPDFETIYIINDQGRLDLEIPLYDKYIKNHDQHRVISKVEQVVTNFYDNDYFNFMHSLYENKFISKKVYNILKHKVALGILRKDKIYSKGKDSNEVL